MGRWSHSIIGRVIAEFIDAGVLGTVVGTGFVCSPGLAVRSFFLTFVLTLLPGPLVRLRTGPGHYGRFIHYEGAV